MKIGIATLPLHWGKAPAWLFQRMIRLSREILRLMVTEYGPQEVLRRIADPFWFQALGCVLGFDWHSSGLTTTVCGALKEALRDMEHETGLFIAGGKGRASRKTPDEIIQTASSLRIDPASLVYASRMSAKVDSAAVQDGYQLYHHVMLYTRDGDWAVVQQGMNVQTRYARRYHWLASGIQDFVCEPHAAICCDVRGITLNLVACASKASRDACVMLATEHPDRVIREAHKIATLELPRRHFIAPTDINPKKLASVLVTTYEAQPENFESLLAVPGVGPKTLRSLALLAELVYGAAPSFDDPARYSFAHGGKDGHPYPVARDVYDTTINLLQDIVNASRIGATDKRYAFRQLALFATHIKYAGDSGAQAS
ncbi:MAG: DUF763 domain-containing protein [Desulfobacterota bacterium]|nr:DUF763 domain-containing protein [Thermodesulfobacteriota bacterium]